MNRRISTILLIALVVSGLASYAVYRLVASRMNTPVAAATTPVVVAARNLEIGTLIRDADIRTGSWTGSLPKGMATKKETILGRGVVAPIYDSEPVMETRLAAPGAGGGLAATIPPGMRAVA